MTNIYLTACGVICWKSVCCKDVRHKESNGFASAWLSASLCGVVLFYVRLNGKVFIHSDLTLSAAVLPCRSGCGYK